MKLFYTFTVRYAFEIATTSGHTHLCGSDVLHYVTNNVINSSCVTVRLIHKYSFFISYEL